MRFRSQRVGGFRVFAVSGVNTISFGVDATAAAVKPGLLCFSVERFDPSENQRFIMPGFKVFRSVIPQPQPNLQVSTAEHPVQSFLWDDFTAKPGRAYEYTFQALRGKPKNLDTSAKPITIKVRTEPLFTKDDHDVFFNRGVASSQAYERRFGNKKPDELEPAAKRAEALHWLTRDLDEAIARFINRARARQTHCCAASLAQIPKGTTAIFSPRSGPAVLDLYVDLVDEADDVSCITLAFGVNETFKNQLKDNTPQSHVTFLLLEKKDQKNKNSTKPFVAINASNNVYKAWGAFIRNPVYQWARETNARLLQLNTHVSYIHSKFLLRDPLGKDPIVVTGSANFSAASTNSNDENMLAIRGNPRVADIYFTEFNRLFNHYYFRSVMESVKTPQAQQDSELFLDETGKEWLKKYAPGKLRAKRRRIYTEMKGFAQA